MKAPIVVNFGGGVNSTAVIAGLFDNGERPDLILFSDTGGEFPETYAHLDAMDAWLRVRDWPTVTRIRWIRMDGTHVPLEAVSLARGELPSLAYGFKGCSVKWKAQPADKFVSREWAPGIRAVAEGVPIVRMLGIDTSEERRAKKHAEGIFSFRYPLIEWDLDRADCVDLIEMVGLPMPRKSSCFFCPAMRKPEVVALSKEHPDLFARAVAIERGALASGKLRNVAGLGRHWSWEDLVASGASQGPTPEIACDCYDGGGS